VTGLIASSRIRPPRKKSIRDVYYQLHWTDKLKSQFDEHWKTLDSTVPENEKLSERNKFLSKIMAQESPTVLAEVNAVIDKDHVAVTEEWKAMMQSVDTQGG
jgi:hypothetical protein